MTFLTRNQSFSSIFDLWIGILLVCPKEEMTSVSSHSTLLATHIPSPYSSFYSGFEDTLERKVHCLGEPDGCMQPHLGWHSTQSNWRMYYSLSHSRSGFHAPLEEIIIKVDNITHTQKKQSLASSLNNFKRFSVQTPQPTITSNDSGHQREDIPCSQKQLLHICSQNFSDIHIIHKNIWDCNQEMYCIATIVIILSRALSTSISQESLKSLPACCKSWFYSSL